MSFTFTLRKTTHKAETLKELSEIYSRVRDESGEGNSTFPKPTVRNGKSIIGVFSYNGRIWSGDSAPGSVLIYDNRVEA